MIEVAIVFAGPLTRTKKRCSTTPPRPIWCHSSKQAFGRLRLSPGPFWHPATPSSFSVVNKPQGPCCFCKHPGGKARFFVVRLGGGAVKGKERGEQTEEQRAKVKNKKAGDREKSGDIRRPVEELAPGGTAAISDVLPIPIQGDAARIAK